MKKWWLIFPSLLLMLTLGEPVEGVGQRMIHVYLDGKKIEFTPPPAPLEGTIMVPIRQIGEKLEAQVTWDENDQSVVLSKNDIQLILPIGGTQIYRNGETVAIEMPARLENGTAWASIRQISEMFGCQVGWEDKSNTVVVSCIPKKQVKVTKIIDGQTIAVDFDGQEKTIHALGTSSLEDYTDKNKELIRNTLLDYARQHLENKNIWVELPEKQDEYPMPEKDTIEAYIYDPSGNMYNAALLDNGFAKNSGYPSNHRWNPLFSELSSKAYNRKIGFSRFGLLERLVVHTEYVKVSFVDFEREIVGISNTEERPIDISGWTLTNGKGDKSFVFPEGFILKDLESVYIASGNRASQAIATDELTKNSSAPLIWTTESVWNKDGDEAILYDNEGYEISRMKYPE